jgi:hypothetical protein
MALTRRRASPICNHSVGEADLFGLLTAPWLALYGRAVASVYTCFFVSGYRVGSWILGSDVTPVYTAFACGRIAAVQALNGEAASLYDPAGLTAVQTAFVGRREDLYALSADFLADHGAVSGASLFLGLCRMGFGDPARLFDRRVCDLIVAYAIIRRPGAIAVSLASPFRPGGIALGSTPVGTLVVITLFGEISRRTFSRRGRAFTHKLPLVEVNLHARRHLYVRLRSRRATIK